MLNSHNIKCYLSVISKHYRGGNHDYHKMLFSLEAKSSLLSPEPELANDQKQLLTSHQMMRVCLGAKPIRIQKSKPNCYTTSPFKQGPLNEKPGPVMVSNMHNREPI